MTEATHHHFVPQFYLRNFATGVGRQASLQVLDLEKRSIFGTRVRNVAGRRNFNRVNFEGVDPNAYETAYGHWGEAAPKLREIIEARAFPSDDHFSHMMNLIALLNVRHPRVRDNLSGSMTQMSRTIAELATASRDRWETLTKDMAEAGHPVDPEVTYEQVRGFIQGGEYDIEVEQSYFVQLEPKVLDPVLRSLAARSWSFKIASESATFVTSDYPAVLRWVNETRQGTPVGHGVAGTMLLIALSPEVALVGAFGDVLPQQVLGPWQVAVVNSIILEHADRQVYMRDASSRFISDAGLIDGPTLIRSRPPFLRTDSRPAGCAHRARRIMIGLIGPTGVGAPGKIGLT